MKKFTLWAIIILSATLIVFVLSDSSVMQWQSDLAGFLFKNRNYFVEIVAASKRSDFSEDTATAYIFVIVFSSIIACYALLLPSKSLSPIENCLSKKGAVSNKITLLLLIVFIAIPHFADLTVPDYYYMRPIQDSIAHNRNSAILFFLLAMIFHSSLKFFLLSWLVIAIRRHA